MPAAFPAPSTRHPVVMPDGAAHPGTVFLNAAIDHPNWDVGDYTYASTWSDPPDWAAHLAPFLHAGAPERLVIGRFCQIADGALFVTSSANHRKDGLSTYPFAIFNGMDMGRPSMPGPGPDTVIGNDVWIGQGATILPGARIGSGTIVGAKAVVGGEVPPYAVVAGNPARVVRERVGRELARRLVDLAWWDWPIERILTAEGVICGCDPEALLALGQHPSEM